MWLDHVGYHNILTNDVSRLPSSNLVRHMETPVLQPGDVREEYLGFFCDSNCNISSAEISSLEDQMPRSSSLVPPRPCLTDVPYDFEQLTALGRVPELNRDEEPVCIIAISNPDPSTEKTLPEQSVEGAVKPRSIEPGGELWGEFVAVDLGRFPPRLIPRAC